MLGRGRERGKSYLIVKDAIGQALYRAASGSTRRLDRLITVYFVYMYFVYHWHI